MQTQYPSNAPRGGSFTLTGNGSTNDILTFPTQCYPYIQNNTASAIYIALGNGTSSPAT